MKALRRAALALVLAEAVLVLGGVLPLRTAVIVALVVEGALAVVVLTLAAVGLRRYRSDRRAGLARAGALREALETVLPRPVATLAVHETALLRSLWLWARRRRDDVEPGGRALDYHRAGRALGIGLLGVSLVELAAVELLVPWPAVLLVLRVLSLYAVVMVVAMLVDPVVRPHVLTATALRLRSGSWADVTIPLGAVASVAARLGTADRMLEIRGGVLTVASGSSTDVELTLARPLALRVGRHEGTVSRVRFSADDPAATVDAIRSAHQGTDAVDQARPP